MTIHHPKDWSLWSVPERGLFLVSEDRPGVLIQQVTVAVERDDSNPALVATSRSPSAARTLLDGEGDHPDIFETALASHLEVLGIDRILAERVDIEDLIPVGAAAPLRKAVAP